jgi:ATP-dependent Clp protease ATP-binding subunit ClpA
MAEKLSHVYVGSEHLLMALLESSEEQFVKELKQVGLNSNTVAAIALRIGNYLPGILTETKEQENREHQRMKNLPILWKKYERAS